MIRCRDSDDTRMHGSILKFDNAQYLPQEFSSFARETLHRYIDSNKELYKLILKMEINDADCASLATELIMNALNLSVNKLHLEFAYSGKPFVLPRQVFESKSLIELSAEYCVINQPLNGNVMCLPLVSLKLITANVKDNMMSDILSRCPLIEYLDLIDGYEDGLSKLCLGETQRNIKHCLVQHMPQTESGAFLVDFSGTRYPNLTTLLFNDTPIGQTFFHNSIDKFPCLIELSLHHCCEFDEVVEISIPSLKFLSLEGMTETRLIFDVPNLSKFKYLGWHDIPQIYINTSSNGLLYCDIAINVIDDILRSWFLGLQEFLQNLRIVSKKISFCLYFIDYYGVEEEDDEDAEEEYEDEVFIVEKDISIVAPCTPVENLVLECLGCVALPLSAFSDLVSGLFSICRPNLITLSDCKRIPPREPSERDLPVIEVLYKSVTEQANLKCGLKQVTLEMLYNVEQTLTEWRPVLWEDLISSIRLKIQSIQIRLKLEWHEGLN